jgi:hypothetical protein
LVGYIVAQFFIAARALDGFDFIVDDKSASSPSSAGG